MCAYHNKILETVSQRLQPKIAQTSSDINDRNPDPGSGSLFGSSPKSYGLVFGSRNTSGKRFMQICSSLFNYLLSNPRDRQTDKQTNKHEQGHMPSRRRLIRPSYREDLLLRERVYGAVEFDFSRLIPWIMMSLSSANYILSYRLQRFYSDVIAYGSIQIWLWLPMPVVVLHHPSQLTQYRINVCLTLNQLWFNVLCLLVWICWLRLARQLIVYGVIF